MSGQSIAYWRAKFDSSCYGHISYQRLFYDNVRDTIYFNAARALLMEYSATNYNENTRKYSGGGWCSLFWARRWGTHHAKEVLATLLSCKHSSLHELRISLQKNLKDIKLEPEGDLSRILQVIQEKTGLYITTSAPSRRHTF